MGFSDAVKSCLQRNYVGFQGRAPRSEYWFFLLAVYLAMVAVFVVGFLVGRMIGGFALVGILGLGLFLPSLAVSVRRLHDTNASGWWYLIAFVPYVGGIALLIWFCIKGTVGENRFGLDPLQGGVAEVFS